MIPLLRVEHRWSCPSCDLEDVTYEPQPHTRMHRCKGLAGLTAPMVQAGSKAKHTRMDREDYLNGDKPRTDADGQVWMSVVTTRDDGEDCTVYAATAESGRE